MKKAFDAFDHDKKGSIGTDMVGTILTMLGYELSEKTLKEIITEVDEDGEKNKLELNKIIAVLILTFDPFVILHYYTKK